LTSLPQDYLTVFVVAFLAVWLILLPVTVRQTLSRWSRLVDQYPDQAEEPLLRLRCNVSTRRRGPVDLHGTLILSACPSGLRVGRRRVFGRWYRDFFMPWERLSVVRQSTILPIAILQFGNPVSATIYLPGYVAKAGACCGESLARNRTIPGGAGRLRPKSSRAIGGRYMRPVLYHGASNSRSECNQAVDSAHNLDPDLALGAFLWCGACSELSLQKKLSAKIGTSCDVPLWHV
jgi:hypothetical protein